MFLLMDLCALRLVGAEANELTLKALPSVPGNGVIHIGWLPFWKIGLSGFLKKNNSVAPVTSWDVSPRNAFGILD